MMRISTAQYFESSAANYTRNYNNLVASSEEATTQVRVKTGADDPVGAARLLQLDQQSSMLKQYSTNTTAVTNKLGQSEAVLTSVTQVLQRARELTMSAGNGAMTDADRGSIASELGQIQDQLQTLMNSKDENGQYLFSGSKSDTAPFSKNADGTYSYNGDQTVQTLQVGDQLSVGINETGYSVFEQAVNTARTNVTAANTDGKATLSNGLVQNSATFNSDFRKGEPYTVTFTSATQLKITDASGNDLTGELSQNGQVTNAAGQSVGFRGLSLNLDVNLAKGDDAATTLTGRSFTLQSTPDSFTVNRNPGNASTAVVTGASVSNAATYSSAFPQGSAVLKYTDANNVALYAAPLTDDSKPVATAAVTAPGTSVSVGGVTFDLSGAAQAGDQFQVAVDNHQTQNILDTLTQLRQALTTPIDGSTTAKQNFQAQLNAGLSNLTSGAETLGNAISSIGARGNALDIQTSTNESLSQANTNTTSSIRNSDYAEVVSRMTLQSTMLQAAQLTFSKVAQLSLFDRL